MAATEQAVAGGVSFALTDEQKELRALAREFAAKEIRPVAAEHDVHMRHPVEVIAKAHEVGLMNLHIPPAYGGPGLGSFDGMLVGEEVNWGCTGIGTSIGANGLGAGPLLIAGTDEQKAKWLPPLIEAADPLFLRALGARGRLGRGAAEDHGGASRRRVRPQRLEDVHHERRLRRLDGRLREDRRLEGTPRDLRLHRPDGHARRDDRAAPRQDGAARDRHVGVRAPGRRRARREPARRGGAGLQAGDADPRRHAAGDGDRRRRCRAGRVRARGRVREGARHVRPADRDAPGRQLHDRRHGDRDRGRPSADLAGRVDARPRRARDAATRRSRSGSPPTRR